MILIAWALLLSHQQAIAHAAIGQPGSQLFVVEVIGKSRFNAAGLIERIYLQDYPEAALAPAPRVLGSPEWSAGEAIQVPPAACCARSAQPRISPRLRCVEFAPAREGTPACPASTFYLHRRCRGGDILPERTPFAKGAHARTPKLRALATGISSRSTVRSMRLYST